MQWISRFNSQTWCFTVAYTISSPLLGSGAFVPFEASLSQANPLFCVPNMQDDGHINLYYEILQRNAEEPIERIFFTIAISFLLIFS
jgi:hypothetical protein